MSDTTAEALSVQEGRLLAFNPAELVIDDKTRKDVEATVTAGFVAGLREYAERSAVYPSAHTEGEAHPCGNHTPIAVMITQDGRFKVRVGRRRTLGCGRAEVAVVGYIVGPEGDSAAEQLAALVDAWSENHDREQTTTADDAVLVEALFEIPGITEAKAAKALRVDRPQVRALRTIAKSPVAAGVAALGVDLIQSAAIAEFTGDPAAVDRLTRIAKLAPDQFDQELAELRATRAVRIAHDKLVTNLEADGYAIHDDAYLPPRRNLANLRDLEGNELTVEAHASCPGRMAVIDLTWTWPAKAKAAWIKANPDVEVVDGEPAVEFDDDTEAQQAGMVPEWFVAGYMCADPPGYGHSSVYDPAPDRDDAAPGATVDLQEAARQRAEAAAREQTAARAEGRRVRERNTLWRAATETRLAHLRAIAARPKLAPKELKVAAALLRAQAITRHETDPQMASFGHRVAAQLLGLKGSEWDSEKLILAALDAASPDRREVIELVMVLAAAEHGLSGADGKDASTWKQAEESWWARAETPPRPARYLRWLRDYTGYRLAPIEAEVIRAVFPDEETAAKRATDDVGGDHDSSRDSLPDGGPVDNGDETAEQSGQAAQDAEVVSRAVAERNEAAEETGPGPDEDQQEQDGEDSGVGQDQAEEDEAEATEAG
jgi:hypothetical protein